MKIKNLKEKVKETNEQRPNTQLDSSSDMVRRGVPKSAGVYIKGTVNNVNVWFTMDTGASRTLVSKKIFEQICDKPVVETDKDVPLSQASGSPLGNMGIATLDLIIGPLNLTRAVFIADIQDDVLVGMDISNIFDVLTSQKKVVLEGQDIPCIVVRTEILRRIYVADDCVIPPETEMVIDAYVENDEFEELGEILFR
jgi:predicted aspartyl protease